MPEIVTGVETDTALVVIVKFAVEDPEGTVTVAGTAAAALLLLERVTTAPAVVLTVTVPVALALPPTRLVGFRMRDVMAGPDICRLPTLDDGSATAYFRTSKLLKLATVPDSPYNATPPDENVPSEVCSCRTLFL